MKRFSQTLYTTDAGRKLVTLRPDGLAYIECANVTPDELCELAMACRAAAEELRRLELEAKEYLASISAGAPDVTFPQGQV